MDAVFVAPAVEVDIDELVDVLLALEPPRIVAAEAICGIAAVDHHGCARRRDAAELSNGIVARRLAEDADAIFVRFDA